MHFPPLLVLLFPQTLEKLLPQSVCSLAGPLRALKRFLLSMAAQRKRLKAALSPEISILGSAASGKVDERWRPQGGK